MNKERCKKLWHDAIALSFCLSSHGMRVDYRDVADLASAWQEQQAEIERLREESQKQPPVSAVFDVDKFCDSLGRLSSDACAKIREAAANGGSDES